MHNLHLHVRLKKVEQFKLLPHLFQYDSIRCSRPSVFDVGPTLYKSYTNVLRFLGRELICSPSGLTALVAFSLPLGHAGDSQKWHVVCREQKACFPITGTGPGISPHHHPNFPPHFTFPPAPLAQSFIVTEVAGIVCQFAKSHYVKVKL